MIKNIELLILILWVSGDFNNALNSQILAQFDFDNCDYTDNTGTYLPGTATGPITCDCGVDENSNALYFNGSNDSLILDQNLKDIFLNDFSVGFYLWVENASGPYPIMSVQGQCSSARDSAFFIRYFPNNDEIIVELTKNFGEVIALRTNLDENRCWNHILFTREGTLYSLYLNGEFIESVNFNSQVFLGEDHPFLVGSSPCVGVSDVPFRGRIDDITFYNVGLNSEEERATLYLEEDQIITQDTTIFEGDQFLIRTSHTCAPVFTWSPTIGLINSTDQNPLASPTVTTTYTFEVDHGTCTSEDRITVSVIAEEDVDCSSVLLPTAFTPNGDNLNDTYGISNDFIVEELVRFEIFDRWGLKLFESFDILNRWDGTYNGKPMPPSTYVYKLEYTCQSQSYRQAGSFNILK